jgi:hypothetical protein
MSGAIYSESDKSKGEYLSTFEGATEGTTEVLNCETKSLLLDEQRTSYNNRFLQTTMDSQIYRYSKNHRYICKHICVYMRSFLPQVIYTGLCLSKLHTLKNVCKNNL